MRNIGLTEVLVILAVVLLLFGGKKLPELARSLARSLRIFRNELKGIEHDDKQDTQAKDQPTDSNKDQNQSRPGQGGQTK